MTDTTTQAKVAELIDTGRRAWGLVNTKALLKRGRTQPLPMMRSVICVYAMLNHGLTSRQVSEGLKGEISPESVRQYKVKHADMMKYDRDYAKLWDLFIDELEKQTTLIA